MVAWNKLHKDLFQIKETDCIEYSVGQIARAYMSRNKGGKNGKDK
jgi:hypothetical protein